MKFYGEEKWKSGKKWKNRWFILNIEQWRRKTMNYYLLSLSFLHLPLEYRFVDVYKREMSVKKTSNFHHCCRSSFRWCKKRKKKWKEKRKFFNVIYFLFHVYILWEVRWEEFDNIDDDDVISFKAISVVCIIKKEEKRSKRN